MESSFCGNDCGPFANYHFSTENLMQTGKDFCKALFIYQQLKTNIPDKFIKEQLSVITNLHEHYMMENQFKDLLQKDPDVEVMSLFFEKMKMV